MTTIDREAMAAKHHERVSWEDSRDHRCVSDGQRWPCDATLALTALEDAERTLATERDDAEAWVARALDAERREQALVTAFLECVEERPHPEKAGATYWAATTAAYAMTAYGETQEEAIERAGQMLRGMAAAQRDRVKKERA